MQVLDAEHWRAHSNPLAHAYRRVESLFGADSNGSRFRKLKQVYETPDAIASGSAAEMMTAARALLRSDPQFVDKIDTGVLRRFAWADGISARLSDSYRGGVIVNFVLSSMAILGGIVYLPFVSADHKWLFALFA